MTEPVDTKPAAAPTHIGWKTITGALIAFLAWISSPEVLAVLPPKVAAFIGSLGVLLSIIGVRHAQAKVLEATSGAQATAGGAKVAAQGAEAAATVAAEQATIAAENTGGEQ